MIWDCYEQQASMSAANKIDPLKMKLKVWQESRGRLKENQLPWQPRFKKVLTENNAIVVLPEKNKNVVNKPSIKASQNDYDRRKQLESWRKPRTIKTEKENTKPFEMKSKAKIKDSVKSTIPPYVVVAPKKATINFIERNKQLASKFQRQKTEHKIIRRVTIADVHLKMRRSSLDKLRRHSRRNTADYYCSKPNVSRKLSQSSNKSSKAIETSKISNEDNSKQISKQISPERKENTKFDFLDLPSAIKRSGKKMEVRFDGGLQSSIDKCNANGSVVNTVASTPIKNRALLLEPGVGDNFHVKFLISPIKRLPKTPHLYSLTPVRRSLRPSESGKSNGCNVYDDLDEIPSNLLSKALFRENTALNI